MKCPTCHLDLKIAIEGQKVIEYCPSCRQVWAYSSKFYPVGHSSHKGRSQTDIVPNRASGSQQKSISSDWDGSIGGLYLPKRKRHAALKSLFYFLSSAAKRSR